MAPCKKKIPIGWDDLVSISSIIPMDPNSSKKIQSHLCGPRFVIFKTPIDNTLWSPKDVIQHCPEMIDEETGCLIINIKPNREAPFWYDPEVLINEGVEYAELYIRGTAREPPDFVVSEFFDDVDEFLEYRPNGLIGVHGTDSVNRPGYLIARYLIEKFSWKPNVAINTINSARQENITQKSLIIDLQENQYLWETNIMQHCVVVEFITDEIADIYRKRPTKEMKDIIMEILKTIPRGVIVWPEPDSGLAHEVRNNADLAAVNFDDFAEGRPGKTWWIGSRFLRLWFRKGWVKRKVIEIALRLPEDSWEDFRIVPYEDRTTKGGRLY